MISLLSQILLHSKNPYPKDHWELIVETTAGSLAYSIDINSGTDLDVNVWWGDGTMDTYTTTGVKSHTYPGAGLYQCKIWGSMTNGNIRQDSTGTYANAPKVKATSAIVGITGWANFVATFNNTRITTCPTDTFKIHTTVASNGFLYTFGQCTSLITIPTDLFRYNTAVSGSGFYGIFFNCTSLITIPTDLFRYNTAVSTNGFRDAFLGCVLLTTAPIDLFRYNTAVSTSGFRDTFQDCVNLQMVAGVFGDLSVITDRFTNRVSDFRGFFQLTAAFTGTQGTAPPLWDANFGTATPVTTDAFTGHAVGSLSNYADIPNDWKGL